MKCNYRGVSYECSLIPVEVQTGELGGKYRGVPWRRYQPKSTSMSQNFSQLKYRGVAYCIGDRQKNQQQEEDAIRLQERFAVTNHKLKNSFKSRDELTKIHLSNIHKNLERRLQLAKHRGDTNLIYLLEEEAKQIAFG